MHTAVVIVSGGLDSVTLAYHLGHEGYDLHLISINYGQRHLKELECAQKAATALHARWDLIDISSMQPLFGSSALTDTTTVVPEGHYAHDVMKQTIVPNRNAIFLSLATAVAVADEAECVALAVHGGDHTIYPDCRPAFIEQFDVAMQLANAWSDPPPHILSPFVQMTKTDIVKLGSDLEVPFADTWSCYVGGDIHCGKCGTDIERKEAFTLAGVADPTTYADPAYGREMVRHTAE